MGRLGDGVAPYAATGSLRCNWKGNRYHIQATLHATLVPNPHPSLLAHMHAQQPPPPHAQEGSFTRWMDAGARDMGQYPF